MKAKMQGDNGKRQRQELQLNSIRETAVIVVMDTRMNGLRIVCTHPRPLSPNAFIGDPGF
jgi:hypothetical protein